MPFSQSLENRCLRAPLQPKRWTSRLLTTLSSVCGASSSIRSIRCYPTTQVRLKKEQLKWHVEMSKNRGNIREYPKTNHRRFVPQPVCPTAQDLLGPLGSAASVVGSGTAPNFSRKLTASSSAARVMVADGNSSTWPTWHKLIQYEPPTRKTFTKQLAQIKNFKFHDNNYSMYIM